MSLTQVPAAMVAADVATQAELDAEVAARVATAVTLTGNQTIAGTKTFSTQPVLPQAMAIGTAQASTSGTAIDFTGIPSWAKRITLLLNNISLSGTATPLVQVGSGSVVTTGYVGGVSQAGTSPSQGAATAGLSLANSSVAASTHVGIAVFTLMDPATNKWVGVSMVTRSDGYGQQGGTAVTLAGALDRIRLTSSNGTDTFDAGSVNLMYEG